MTAESHQTPPIALNRCNVPPWALADIDFQDHPHPIEIDGVRRTDRRLFERLILTRDQAARARVFHEYLTVKFSLHEWASLQPGPARSSLRFSYVRFLQAWGAESNGHAGAVLKAWVESRFGITATYHAGVLAQDAAARRSYAVGRTKGAAKTTGLSMQLDLLYTFCQDELALAYPGEESLTLYRGTHDSAEYQLSPDSTPDFPVVRLNNLSSFTANPEIAWEFGSQVWKVRVPLAKIVFFSGLLPAPLLSGEAEYLVLGGEYRVEALRY